MAQVERGTNRIYGIRRDRHGARRSTAGPLVLTAVLAVPVGVGFLLLVAGGSFADAMRATYGWSETTRATSGTSPAGRSASRCWCSRSRCCSTTRRAAGSRRCPGWRSAPGISVLLTMAATGAAGGLRPPQRLVRRDLRPARRGVRAAAVVAAQLDRALRGRGGLRPAGVPARRAAAPGRTTTRAARRPRWCRIEPGDHTAPARAAALERRPRPVRRPGPAERPGPRRSATRRTTRCWCSTAATSRRAASGSRR